jgi:hypothetical protein
MIFIPHPQVVQVEVVATQPQAADTRTIEHLRTTSNADLEDVAYIVKIDLSEPLPATSAGVALYVGDYRINRYYAFPGGIYFKVYDPNFFAEHGGDAIQFSVAGTAMQDSGYRLPDRPDNLPTEVSRRGLTVSELPTQEAVLRPRSRENAP